MPAPSGGQVIKWTPQVPSLKFGSIADTLSASAGKATVFAIDLSILYDYGEVGYKDVKFTAATDKAWGSIITQMKFSGATTSAKRKMEFTITHPASAKKEAAYWIDVTIASAKYKLSTKHRLSFKFTTTLPFSFGCHFPKAEHPHYTNKARNAVLCGNKYTKANMYQACSSSRGWKVCTHKEWQERYKGYEGKCPAGGTFSGGGKFTSGRWEAGRPTNTQTYPMQSGCSAYNPWNSGKYLVENHISKQVMKGSGSCCGWDTTFSKVGPGSGYAVYCCKA